jgi:hypothetical protein
MNANAVRDAMAGSECISLFLKYALMDRNHRGIDTQQAGIEICSERYPSGMCMNCPVDSE